jgi:hypothetical protein
VERALAALPASLAGDLVKRLRRTLIGRGLVIVAPDLPPDLDEPPFDLVVRFDRGTIAERRDRRARKAPELEAI